MQLAAAAQGGEIPAGGEELRSGEAVAFGRFRIQARQLGALQRPGTRTKIGALLQVHRIEGAGETGPSGGSAAHHALTRMGLDPDAVALHPAQAIAVGSRGAEAAFQHTNHKARPLQFTGQGSTGGAGTDDGHIKPGEVPETCLVEVGDHGRRLP